MNSILLNLGRRLAPEALLSAYRGRRILASQRRASAMSAEEVFTEIYARNAWGGAPGQFRSGDGSALQQLVRPYVEVMRQELARIDAQMLTVVDLGCGDFEVGQQLADLSGRYVGVDIVRPLVERNRARYAGSRITFEHRNIIESELPTGDVCLVRQVFQHLSNREIAAVLPKLGGYRYCYVTEHHPSPGRLSKANIDKPHGSDIRVIRRSGVFLDEPPFCIPREKYRLILETPGVPNEIRVDPGVIRTYLLTS